MTALTCAPALTLAELAVRGTDPAGGGPGWGVDARREAVDWILEHGFPTRKDEDWRYLPLGSILEHRFSLPVEPVSGPGDQAGWQEIADSASLGLGGSRLVFVDGRFAPSLSRLGRLPPGTLVDGRARAAAADPERFGEGAPIVTGAVRHAFEALNVALAADGALVDVPAGAVVEEPIELVFLGGGGRTPVLSCPRSLIRLGPRSEATIVEVWAGASDQPYLSDAVTEVELGEEAEVVHYLFQDQPESAFHFSSLRVRQADGSRCASRLVALGAAVARNEITVLLEGEGASVDLDGLYFPRGVQHHDHPILVEHAAPRGTSRQRYVGIVDGRGHGVFNGHVVVGPGAAGTDASQSDKNLLLSDQAEVDTRPRLEIFTDDVACAHGAAVGRLDGDALFYLRSRGIPEARARGLLVQGFVAPVLDRLELGQLRARVRQRIDRRFATGLGGRVPPGAAEVRGTEGVE